MKPRVIAAIALMALLLTGPAIAAPAATPHVTSELVAQTIGAAPGSTIYVALAQTLEKGWHTYWRNPGEAGEATRITWTLPAGWRAGDIVWPTPKRLPVGPIMNYGYEGKLILASPIEVPVSATPGQSVALQAVADYLVCADVCIPGRATVRLVLPIVAGAPPADPRWGQVIADTLAAAPKPAGLAASFQTVGGRLKVAVAGAPLAGATAADAYLYPYDGTLIDHGKPEAIERGPRGLTLTMTPGVAFTRGPAPSRASGVLTLDGKAYEITARPGPPPAGAAGLGPPAPATGGALGLPLAVAFAFSAA